MIIICRIKGEKELADLTSETNCESDNESEETKGDEEQKVTATKESKLDIEENKVLQQDKTTN